MIPALALLTRVPVWVYPAAALVVWAGCSSLKANQTRQKLEQAQLVSAESRAKEQERNRITEQALVTGAGKVVDELSKAQQANTATVRGANTRLRATAAAWAASTPTGAAATACRSDVTPAIGIIRDETREDLVLFAEEAESVRLRLLACQALVKSNYEELRGHR